MIGTHPDSIPSILEISSVKMRKIIFIVALFVLTASTSPAKDIDKTTENYQRTTKRFVCILSEQWGIDQGKISGESFFLRDFGADSLDIMELVMALEEDFDIEIPDEEWAKITTVDSAIHLILERVERRYSPEPWR